MNDPAFMDDLCGDFFDNIDDILDFPTEDVEGGINGDCNDGFPPVWTAPPDSLGSSSVFSSNSSNNASELTTELSVPYDDFTQLDWFPNLIDDSFSCRSISPGKDSNSDTKSPQFQTSSPVSVLESSSSCSGGKPLPLRPETFVPGRARSKRPRPAAFNPRSVIPLVSPTSSAIENAQPLSSSELSSDMNFGESKPPKAVASEQKKKKKKNSPPQATMETEQYCSPQPVAVRKCMHCEITKTPQWRAGPMGPKTLCNACGVRYKSGRLFPEYRPAASPTFVTTLHSNSHKKVIEMRSRACHKTAMAADETTPPPELVPNSRFLDDYL